MSEEQNPNPTKEQKQAAVDSPTINQDAQPTEQTGVEVQTTVAEETPIVEAAAEPIVAHDDFDWAQTSKHELPYSQDEIAQYLSEYERTMNPLNESELVKGLVVSLTDSDVVLDLQYKADGLVSRSEFRDMPELAVGDQVEVYVERREDERGQLVLSRRKAKLLRAWEDIVDSYHNGSVITGQVVSKTKGGLIVDAGGLETFLPGSQIDIKPIIDYDSYVGKTMEFKVVKVNEAIKNAVVSHKALIESDLAEQREAIIAGLEKGQVLEGVVKNITDFGAFMDLGGVDGLLYITDISWGRINHPSDVLELNQQINVVVLDFDENKKRISLGLKQLQPHPWDVLAEDIAENSVVKGRIVNIEDYGGFLEITPGVEGLIHVSEISWSNQPINARDYFTLGQEFESKVVTIDRDERKMSLSLKQLTKDPWSDIETRFPHHSHSSGEVKNLTPYGVFVELEDGIGGMVHISDLSWTKRYSHPSEFTQIGKILEVVILDIDKENRKLSLGHKQIEENPWDTFEQVFPVGSYHEATIIRKDDRGAIVQLPYGLEAFAPGKHLKQEDGSSANVDATLTFKVIEFNRDDKRIIVSHSRYLDDIRRDERSEERGRRREERQRTQKVIRKQQSRVELTTLGELDVFSQLKEQLAQPQEPVAQETKEEVAPVPEVKEGQVEVAAAEATGTESDETAEGSAEEATESGQDDLKKIEGVGPKTAQILNEAGLTTYAAIASAGVDKIREVLAEAGSRYKTMDPTTWPEQAGLAAAGKWEELKELQDKLDGGRR